VSDDEAKTSGTEPQPASDAPKEELTPPPHWEEELSETRHSVIIDGVEVPYVATAGRMLLREEDGKKKASFFFVSYVRSDVENVAERPLVFCFNGGPGSSSVWLHLGGFGPKRVELTAEGQPPPPPGRLVANDESLLDVADLVFIDPVGTGFSRGIPGGETKRFAHFTRDIESVGELIRLFLGREGRWGSPKYLAGESYGTTRAAGLAHHLLNRHGITLNGLLLVSSILNFGTSDFDRETWTFARGNDLPYALFLPAYAAAAHYHGRLATEHQQRPLRTFLAEVEEFAGTEYQLALFAGDDLPAERRLEIASRVAAYTGLEVDYVLRYDLRLEILRFCKELRRDEGLTVGRLDARYSGFGRFRDGDAMEQDPSSDAITGPFAAALNDYVRRELAYASELPYEILSETVHSAWDYEDFKNAQVDVSERLRETMTRNPFMRVFVANGYYDLATPYSATEYTFRHLGLEPPLRENVSMGYYEAGHMMYVHEPSRRALAADLRRFVVA
jgi:carboxypeptidase C (cathepsin A)